MLMYMAAPSDQQTIVSASLCNYMFEFSTDLTRSSFVTSLFGLGNPQNRILESIAFIQVEQCAGWSQRHESARFRWKAHVPGCCMCAFCGAKVIRFPNRLGRPRTPHNAFAALQNL